MKKRNIIGACVMVAAILAAVPLGAHTSLTRLREDAQGSYYYDNTGYAIYEGLDQRQATANNLITVARRYTSVNSNLTGLIDDLDYAVRLTNGSYDDDAQEAQANQMMGEAAQALYEELKKTDLSEEDQKYPDQLIAEMESEQDKLNRSSYNEDAREFNQKLKSFPVNLLLPLTGVQPLATYDYE
ncbi:MAG: LemA family protein [Acutalibacter sp.]